MYDGHAQSSESLTEAQFQCRVSAGSSDRRHCHVSPAFDGMCQAPVADITRFDDEDDVLCNVRGVIADALEMAGNQNQVDGRLDSPSVREHERQELPHDL